MDGGDEEGGDDMGGDDENPQMQKKWKILLVDLRTRTRQVTFRV